MSVIMGCKIKNKVYLAADKRISDENGKILHDNGKKIQVINNHLAVACAGNRIPENSFADLIAASNQDDRKKMVIEDMYSYIASTSMITNFFLKKNKQSKQTVFGYILAGKNKKHDIGIKRIKLDDGVLVPDLTQNKQNDIVLFPPSGISENQCYDILKKNMQCLPENDFLQETIKEIALISNLVSPTGNIWTYDIEANHGELIEFL